MTTAALVVIGNELLTAKITDENGPWLLRELRGLGVEVRRVETVPDEIPLIQDALRRCRAAADWVFTSGGIGPTHDDVTLQAVAELSGRKLVAEPRALAWLTSRYGGELNAARRRLAEVPEGAEVVWDEGAFFPIVILERAVILPGVPALFRAGFGRVRERFRGAPFYSRAVFLSLGEGAIAAHLDATVAAYPDLAIGSYPRFDEADHRVKVTFDGRSAERVESGARDFAHRLPAGAVVREG